MREYSTVAHSISAKAGKCIISMKHVSCLPLENGETTAQTGKTSTQGLNKTTMVGMHGHAL